MLPRSCQHELRGWASYHDVVTQSGIYFHKCFTIESRDVAAVSSCYDSDPESNSLRDIELFYKNVFHLKVLFWYNPRTRAPHVQYVV